MNPTPQQQAFLTALLGTTAHLALVARAGCGKTRSILMAISAIRAREPNAEVLAVAFNKAIALELGNKIKAEGHTDWRLTQSSTAHALGFGLLKYAFSSTIDDRKVRKLIEAKAALIPAVFDGVFARYGRQVEQLVGYGKQAAVGLFGSIADSGLWQGLADHYGMEGSEDATETDAIIAAAQLVYRESCDDVNTIDFDDMILLPLVKNLRVRFAKDYVFVDEAQDLSPARQAFIRKFVKPRTGRMIVVGDDRQAIYGFSGADAQALPNLIAELGATVLPLSVTWRCPKAVVALAQTLVPDIEAADTAPEGEVITLRAEDEVAALMASLTPGRDAIGCRNTAPLIALAYQLIRAGVPAKVEGRAIGEGLAALAKRWKVESCAALLNRLEAYEGRETAKLQAKGRDDAIEALHDKVETLVEITKACQQKGQQRVSDVLAAIDALFGDDVKDAVTLATYHRLKGREFPRMILWEHAERCPSKAARQPWQRAQEANLAYVAYTRAMQTLVFAW